MKHTITQLYEYNYWANHLILQKAKQVGDHELNLPTAFSAGSLRQTLIHTLSAEWIWRSRCQLGISPSVMLQEADFPSLASIISRWQEEEKVMRAYLNFLTVDDLDKTISYITASGRISYQQKLSDILCHVVLHGMQHRSEMAAMLTNFGQSPGDIDFIMFLRRITL